MTHKFTREQSWKYIVESFEVPTGFLARLCKEQGWSSTFASEAVDEYLKFLFLCEYAEHPATPSEVIDDVWHLHLIYSESYANLCHGAFGRFIHHSPGDGTGDDLKFRHRYIQTLESYAENFGHTNERYWPKFDVKKFTAPIEEKFEDKSKAGWFKKTTDRIFGKSAVDSPNHQSNVNFGTCGVSDFSSNTTHSHTTHSPTNSSFDFFGGGSFGGSGAGSDWGGSSDSGASHSSCGNSCVIANQNNKNIINKKCHKYL